MDEKEKEKLDSKLFYSETFDRMLRDYRKSLVNELNALQLVYQVKSLLGTEVKDYESYLNLCVFILNQIKSVTTFIKDYTQLDEDLGSFTPSLCGNEQN